MWRQRRNRNRTDEQTEMCSPLMRFDLKGKKERALLKCLIALLWIGNIFYNERYSSDLCKSKYTLKLCFVSLNNFSIMKETLVIIIVVIKLPKIHGGSQRELFNQKIVICRCWHVLSVGSHIPRKTDTDTQRSQQRIFRNSNRGGMNFRKKQKL